jgi:hypothetical protein
MCDFSLEAVRSRSAKVGDRLTTHRFNLGNEGFVRTRRLRNACLPPSWHWVVLRGRSQTIDSNVLEPFELDALLAQRSRSRAQCSPAAGRRVIRRKNRRFRSKVIDHD